MMTGGQFCDLVLQQKERGEYHLNNLLCYGPVLRRLPINDLPPPYISLCLKNEAEVKETNRTFQKLLISGGACPLEDLLGISLLDSDEDIELAG